MTYIISLHTTDLFRNLRERNVNSSQEHTRFTDWTKKLTQNIENLLITCENIASVRSS